MEIDTYTAFGEGLLGLYTAFAGADALVARADRPPSAVADDADALLAAFERAPDAERGRYVLRALDQAIVAFELAARLADEYHGVPTSGLLQSAPPAPANDPLAEVYGEFVASQPGYQSLYHYRNTLATRLDGQGTHAEGASASTDGDE